MDSSGSLNCANVLVVDGFEPLRRFLRESFERLGFHVVEADSFETAEAAYRHSGRRMDLVVCEIWIPGDELRVGTHLRQIQPGVPLLFLSLYGDAPEDCCPGLEGARFLVKPFSLTQLRRGVRELMKPENAPASVEALPVTSR